MTLSGPNTSSSAALYSVDFHGNFIASLPFRNMASRAATTGLIWGVALYSFHNFVLYVPDMLYRGEIFFQHMGIAWMHDIDVVTIISVTCTLIALAVNYLFFANRAVFIWSKEGRRLAAVEA
jgi:SSS family solute:Na+ symporter